VVLAPDKKENPFMKSLMHDMVVHSLDKYEKKMNVESLMAEKRESDKSCNFCGDCPCVWIAQRLRAPFPDEHVEDVDHCR
jgi:hypothetical protein